MSEKLTKLWLSHLKRFRRRPLSLDFKHVVQKHLNVKPSQSYTHYIHSYPGKMLRYIPAFFFSIPQLCSPDGIVLDPLCGSGTVLLDSMTHPLLKRRSYGVEMNPLGRLIAKVKTTPLDELVLRKRIDGLLRLTEKPINVSSLPESKTIQLWFSKKAILELAKLKHLVQEEGPEDDYKDFLWVCFSSIVRKTSLADPFIPPPVLLKTSKYEKSPQKLGFLRRHLERARNPDVVNLFRTVAENNYGMMDSLCKHERSFECSVKAEIIWDDAKHIRAGKLGRKGELIKSNATILPKNSIDCILTSPPYLTAQKYIRTQKLELLWLDLTSDTELLDLQRRIIGSEYVSLKEIDFAEEMGIKSVDCLIKWALPRSPERAGMLYNYFHGMKQAMMEMYRVLRSESYSILVIGNNKVLGKDVETYRHLIDIAIDVGYRLELVLKDEIRGRGMITKRHDTGGLIKEEFVLVLRKN